MKESGKPIQGPVRVKESYIGYDSKGKPVQGAASPFIEIPTIGGATQKVNVSGTNYTVDGKLFATEKEANAYIKKEYDKLPFTDTKSILYPLTEYLYKSIDSSAKYNFENLEKKPDDFETNIHSAAITFQGSVLTGLQSIREFVQTKVLKREPTITKQITSIPTLESKGLEKSTEGVGVQGTYPFVTGVDLNPLSEKNPISKYYQGVSEQWIKQTDTRNAAQLLVMAPVVAFDIATLGEGGLAVGRVAGRVITKIVSPVIAQTVKTRILLGGLQQGIGITPTVKSTVQFGKFDYIKSGTVDVVAQKQGTFGKLAKKNYLDNIELNIQPTKLVKDIDPYTIGTVVAAKTGSYGNLAKKNYLDDIDFNYPKLSQFQSTGISLGAGKRIGDIRTLKGVGYIDTVIPAQSFGEGKIIKLGVGGVKREKIEQVFYHGTTVESAKSIIKTGFDFGKSKTSKGTMFAASSKEIAFGEMGSLLKITMKKEATSIRGDLAPTILRRDPFKGWDMIRDKAKKMDYDIIENLKSPKYMGREVEILSNKNIKKIEETILNVKKEKTLSELAAEKSNKLGSPFSQEKEIEGFIDIGVKTKPITLNDLAATKAPKFVEKQTPQKEPQTLLLKEKEVEKITPVQLSMFHQRGIKLGAARVIAPTRPSIKPRVVITSLPKEKTTQKQINITREKQTQKQVSVSRTDSPQTQILLNIPTHPRAVKQSTNPMIVSLSHSSSSLIPRQISIIEQIPELVTKQVPKLVSELVTKQVPREVPRQVPRLRSILRTVPILKQVPETRKRPPPGVVVIFGGDEKKKNKSSKSKQYDFLGNTKLDSIEGLFRRSTIIHGDKKISKQVKKDSKAKFKERGVSFFSKR